MSLLLDALTRRRFLWLSALAGGTLVLGGCSDEPREQAPSSTTFDEEEPAAGEGAGGNDATSAENDAEVVRSRVDAMTLEQKVAQLFVVAPEALVEDVAQVTAAGDMTHEGVKAHPVGGIVYFAQNLIDPDQTTEMLANVKHFYSEDGNIAYLSVRE